MKQLLAVALALTAAPALAQTAPPPKLVVVVSVDQFSADLFAEYRGQFREGFARLLSGGVFPSGYQSHGATETCPGHSTILTGARPARTGIIGNDWMDFSVPREDKTVNCSEDPTVPGSTSKSYTVSPKNLKVSTLGEWMKLADPASRVVSVAGKDRAALMMGGHKTDELWWISGKTFTSFADRAMPEMVAKANRSIETRLATAREPMELPAFCQARSRAISVGGGKTVGTWRFDRAAGDLTAFRLSPEYDEAVFDLATDFATGMKLGQGASTDLLIVGASVTDYIGHQLGTRGSEMCLQMMALDHSLGQFFAALDKTGVDYSVVLTADHGGLDLPERTSEDGSAGGERVDRALNAGVMGKEIAAKLGLTAPVLHGGSFGDIYADPKLTLAQRKAVLAEATARYTAHPQIRAVYTKEQVAATPKPKGPPDTWSLLEELSQSYYSATSGDLLVVLQPRVTPLVDPVKGAVATHTSGWAYNRRVPILFWRKGMTGFEQPLSVETVDIAPTLAAMLHIPVPVEIDGKCLDLDSGPGDSCK
ncbi:MAG: alkaline phosphatase family protein [Sphingomonas sp.]|uniref:alkaline phosphatase family protein n=1 Tax=Sphingomonas sp. TaxID=28214 RepID=UPI0025D48E6C|nr:alkaline phosphatase family protein [Sphingomonas sp.]MBX3563829.1 alkaline phosphatase family protein [Sphingomonas sp.]